VHFFLLLKYPHPEGWGYTNEARLRGLWKFSLLWQALFVCPLALREFTRSGYFALVRKPKA